MEYGHLEGINLPISRLVLGTMVCHSDDMAATNALLDAWMEAGGDALDTARVYGGGKSEAAVGNWFKSRGVRETVVLIAKGAHHDHHGPRVNPEAIGADIEISLNLMQTDYIDLYLLHRDDPNVPVGPIVDSLNAQRAAGKIRTFGGSNWSIARIEEANAYATAHGLQGFVASSPYFGLAQASEPMWPGCTLLETADRQWHADHQFPLFPWSSQASGFFTGRYTPEDTTNKDVVRVYYSDGNWERLKRAQTLGESRGVSANNIALAYVLHQPFPVFALIGPRNPEELASSLPAIDVSLTEAEMRWLNLETDTL